MITNKDLGQLVMSRVNVGKENVEKKADMGGK
jgi:hypothetical protein